MSVTFLLNPFLDLRLIKKVIIGSSVATLAFIPLDLAMVLHKGSDQGGKQVLSPKPTSSHTVTYDSLSSYETALRNSSLFGSATPEFAPVVKSSIAELTKDYRLKGVVIMDQPEAILEDARTQKSQFIRAGDSVGEMKVKEIREGAMVLSYYGEEKELRIE